MYEGPYVDALYETPNGCNLEQDHSDTVEFDVCGSFEGAGIEAYKAYCLENFDSVRDSVAAQDMAFYTAYEQFADFVGVLAQNDENYIPETSMSGIMTSLDQMGFALDFQEGPNFCLEGCALFVGQACCEDSLPHVQCIGTEEVGIPPEYQLLNCFVGVAPQPAPQPAPQYPM
jgi:hypothetical protein